MHKLSINTTENEQKLGIIYLLFQQLCLSGILAAINHILGTPLSATELNLVFFGLNFLCVLLIFHKFLWQSLKKARENVFSVLGSAVLAFLLYRVLTGLISRGIYYLMPDFSNVNDANISTLTQEHFSLMVIGLVLLVPITEEVLFRGIVFRSLYNIRPWLGYLVSTLAFSAIHVLGYIGSYTPWQLVLCFIQYLPAGICLGWCYARSDTIVTPILIHITINQIGVAAMR